MRYATINAYVPKEVFAKFIVVVTKYCVNLPSMDAIVLKGIVPQIIVLVLLMEENVIPRDVKIVIFKNTKKSGVKI